MWVSLLSAALLLSRFLLKPSDLLLLRDKGDTQETREAVPSGAGGEAGKGWEERDLLLWHLLITSHVHTNKDNLRMPGSGVVTRMCGGVFWDCLKVREEQQHVRAEQPLTHVWLSAKSCCGPHIYLHLVKDLVVLTKKGNSAQTPTQRYAPVSHNIRNACLTISTFTLTHDTGLKAWLVIQISRIGLLLPPTTPAQQEHDAGTKVTNVSEGCGTQQRWPRKDKCRRLFTSELLLFLQS